MLPGDPEISIEVTLEAGADTGEPVVIGRVEGTPEVLHHILAVELRAHNLRVKQELGLNLLDRVLVKLGGDLTIRDPLQGLGPELALQGLRGSLGKLRVSTLLVEVHVVGDLRE